MATVIKPEFLYGDLKDKYVAKAHLYADSSKVLYYDSTKKISVSKAELLDLASKGLVAVVDTDVFFPVSYKTDGASVTCMDTAGSAATYTAKDRTEE